MAQSIFGTGQKKKPNLKVRINLTNNTQTPLNKGAYEIASMLMKQNSFENSINSPKNMFSSRFS